jgi:hypothetical protein
VKVLLHQIGRRLAKLIFGLAFVAMASYFSINYFGRAEEFRVSKLSGRLDLTGEAWDTLPYSSGAVNRFLQMHTPMAGASRVLQYHRFASVGGWLDLHTRIEEILSLQFRSGELRPGVYGLNSQDVPVAIFSSFNSAYAGHDGIGCGGLIKAGSLVLAARPGGLEARVSFVLEPEFQMKSKIACGRYERSYVFLIPSSSR